MPRTMTVQRTMTIGAPADDLLELWCRPGVLEQVMGHFAVV